MEILGSLLALFMVWYVFFKPADKNSTSYKLGAGVGRKTRKLGKWIMDENE